jgi:hypothetical protein
MALRKALGGCHPSREGPVSLAALRSTFSRGLENPCQGGRQRQTHFASPAVLRNRTAAGAHRPSFVARSKWISCSSAAAPRTIGG